MIDRLGLASGNDVKAQLFMLGNGVNTTRSTSAGRLFDAVSAVLGVRMSSSFESEASMALEFAAGSFAGSVPQCSIKMFAEDTADELFRLNTTGLARYIAEARLGGMRIEEAAALFHALDLIAYLHAAHTFDAFRSIAYEREIFRPVESLPYILEHRVGYAYISGNILQRAVSASCADGAGTFMITFAPARIPRSRPSGRIVPRAVVAGIRASGIISLSALRQNRVSSAVPALSRANGVS